MMLFLKELNKENISDEYQFLTALEPENGFENRFFDMSFNHFVNEGYLELYNESRSINLKPGRVPQTYFFLWDDDHIVGLFKVRHYLNDFLRTGPGHIGFAIGKDFRRKGYATKGLALLLKQVKDLIAEDEIYLSCSATNIGSYKVQIHNGAYIVSQNEHEIMLRINK